MIELTLRYLSTAPRPATPPDVSVYMNDTLLAQTDPRYEDTMGRLNLELIGVLPEGDFTWRMASQAPDRLEIHIDA